MTHDEKSETNQRIRANEENDTRKQLSHEAVKPMGTSNQTRTNTNTCLKRRTEESTTCDQSHQLERAEGDDLRTRKWTSLWTGSPHHVEGEPGTM